jgi:hypothetical protein
MDPREFCKGLRSARKRPDQNGVALQNPVSNINGLAQSLLCYRYTIPHQVLDITVLFSESLANDFGKSVTSYNHPDGVGLALVESLAKQPAIDRFGRH